MSAGAPSRARRFYGWRIVGVAFFVDFIAVGFSFYSNSVFLKTVAADLAQGSRGEVSLGISISNLCGALLAPFVGRALDRHSIKRIMIAGAVATSLGFALLSQVQAIWQYYLAFATFLAFGLGMMGGFASSKLVANWFNAQRGMAMGIATVGVSLSGLVMPAAATGLISSLGWRGAYGVYAIVTFGLVVPVVARWVVNRPEDLGLQPDGAAPPEPSEPVASEVVWRSAELVRSRSFWAIGLCFALSFATLSAILTHLVAHASDLGVPAYRAWQILSAAAVAGMAGKFAYGWLFDWTDARLALLASIAGQALGLLLLMHSSSFGGLMGAGIVFGFGMGGVVPLQGSIVASAFGRLSFGKALGLLRPFQMPIQALGIPLAGWIYDATGSYDLAFRIFLGSYAAAAAAALLLRLPRAGLSSPAPTRAAPR